MAIKERKQITGTEAQIKGYAGHNGVLAYATDTKHLHVLSGTAGTTTKLANVSDIPAPVDISGKADKTYVDTQLGTKATKTELTTGLAEKANSYHTHTKSQITDFPEIPDTSPLIPKTGARGSVAGWEVSGRYTQNTVTITKDSPDTLTEEVWMLPATGVAFAVPNGDGATTFTKVVKVYNADTFSLGGNWKWAGNKVPEMKRGFVVLHWNNNAGVATLIAME
jgi:hypothetical protein